MIHVCKWKQSTPCSYGWIVCSDREELEQLREAEPAYIDITNKVQRMVEMQGGLEFVLNKRDFDPNFTFGNPRKVIQHRVCGPLVGHCLCLCSGPQAAGDQREVLRPRQRDAHRQQGGSMRPGVWCWWCHGLTGALLRSPPKASCVISSLARRTDI